MHLLGCFRESEVHFFECWGSGMGHIFVRNVPFCFLFRVLPSIIAVEAAAPAYIFCALVLPLHVTSSIDDGSQRSETGSALLWLLALQVVVVSPHLRRAASCHFLCYTSTEKQGTISITDGTWTHLEYTAYRKVIVYRLFDICTCLTKISEGGKYHIK